MMVPRVTISRIIGIMNMSVSLYHEPNISPGLGPGLSWVSTSAGSGRLDVSELSRWDRLWKANEFSL